MKAVQKKQFPPLFAAVCAAAAAVLGLGLLRREPIRSGATGEPCMVKTVQTGLGGERYELEIYRDETGLYHLSDRVRNITVCDGSSIGNWYAEGENFTPYTSLTGEFSDPTAVTLFYNCVQTYDAYALGKFGFSLQGMNGKNDEVLNNAEENGEIVLYAIAHLNDIFYRYNAAFSPQWDETGSKIVRGYMLVGDGSPEGVDSDKNQAYHFYNQARSLDTIGHEYQHGVTRDLWRYSASAKGDLGAINEAVSDIFGTLIENAEEGLPLCDGSWDVGTEATYDGLPLYSMRLAGKGYCFSLSERKICAHEGGHTAACDNGFVHYNSTILTNAQYEAWKKMPDYFTPERIGKLWYEAIHHVAADSTLEDFAVELLRAAETLGFDRRANTVLYDIFSEKGFSIHSVTFENADGTLLKRDYAKDGGAAVPPATPLLDGTERTVYLFKGWDGDPGNISKDQTFRAEYLEQERLYQIGFYMDGTFWKSAAVPYGTVALPALPDGYDGWYLDDAFHTPADGVYTVDGLCLYAKKKSPVKIFFAFSAGFAAAVWIAEISLIAVAVKNRR